MSQQWAIYKTPDAVAAAALLQLRSSINLTDAELKIVIQTIQRAATELLPARAPEAQPFTTSEKGQRSAQRTKWVLGWFVHYIEGCRTDSDIDDAAFLL
jgi:hypothetical protein